MLPALFLSHLTKEAGRVIVTDKQMGERAETERRKYLPRRRLPRLLPLVILLACLALGLFFIGAGAFWLGLAIAALIAAVVGSVLQEFSLLMDRLEYPACPVCGCEDSDFLYPKDNLAMVSCAGCGQVMAKPRFGPIRRAVFLQAWSWKEAKNVQSHQSSNSGESDPGVQKKLTLLSHYGFPGKGTHLLDVGCGAGTFLRAARGAGFDVAGIEPGWFTSKKVRARFSIDVRTSSLESCGIRERFDAVTGLHVIEHTPDPLAFLRRMRELCKSGGIAVVATPNLGCEYARKLGVDWEAVGPADHLFLFDQNTLKSILLMAGFKPVSITETGNQGEELVAVCFAEDSEEGVPKALLE